MWKLYSHTNKINGKVYIGITSKENPNRRWSNGNGYKRIRKFYCAIKKYGWNNFEHEILFDNLDEDTAKKLEIEYIKKYKEKNISYNVSDGGDGNKGWIMNEETKRKISKKHKGKKISLEHRKKISEGNKGKVLSEETKRKMSESKKGHLVQEKYRNVLRDYIIEYGHPNLGKKYTNEEKFNMKLSQKNRIVIERYSKDGKLIETFNSIREIRKINGLNALAIRKICDENVGVEFENCKTYKGDIFIRRNI